MIMADEHSQELSRSQRRFLCRIYNGRTVPIMADGRAFLTYREAREYLQSLPREACDAAYAEMRSQAK